MEPGKTSQHYKGIHLSVSVDNYALAPISRENFIKFVEKCGGIGLIDEDVDPTVGPLLIMPSDVQLRDDAKFSVVTVYTRAEQVGLAAFSSYFFFHSP